MSKCIKLDIKDTACLHIVQNLHHSTSCPRTKSKLTTMVDAPKMNFTPLLAGKYGRLKVRSTQRRDPAKEGNSGFEAERVRALGALRSLRSKKMLAAEKGRETHFFSYKELEKCIEDYVERKTAGAIKRVEDAEAAISEKQEYTETAENAGLMTREPKKGFPT